MNKYDIAIIGGDKRTACMAPVFMQKGYQAICYGTVRIDTSHNLTFASSLRQAIDSAPVVVCGIPIENSKERPEIKISEIQRCLRKRQKIFGGVIPDSFRRICEERGIGCYDFMADMSVTIFNAIATAEGAILEAMLHRDTNLHKSPTLVLGYGRCGKVLADKLNGLSAQVCVCSADKEELALANALGFHTFSLTRLKHEIHTFSYIFNTIPAVIITKDCLERLSPDALIIDIASGKGGVEYTADSSHHALHCMGLPGKYASQSSAKRLVEYVIQNTSETRSRK